MFGRALHVAGIDRAALERAIATQGGGLDWREVEPRLEDVFIHMLSVQEEGRMSASPSRASSRCCARSRSRSCATRMTLRIIILVPLIQLFLFGYAINSDPKHLPAGLLSIENSKYTAHHRRGAAQHRLLRHPHAAHRGRGRAGARARRAAFRHRDAAGFRPRRRPRRGRRASCRRRRDRPDSDRQRRGGARPRRRRTSTATCRRSARSSRRRRRSSSSSTPATIPSSSPCSTSCRA